MQVIRDIQDIPPTVPSVVTIGTFDGLHLGHQQILKTVSEIARTNNYRSVLITFDPHPREVLGTNGQPLFLLTTIDERIELVEKENIDLCIVIPFTRTLSLLSAEEFFEKIIVEKAGARHVVVGFDHKFGKGRGADAKELERIAREHNIQSTTVMAYTIDGQKISSTTARKALFDGNVEYAHTILGRPFTIQGIVQRGDGLGKIIGYPTANVHQDNLRKILPKSGVYIVQAYIKGQPLTGVMNIGTRPTVSEQHQTTIEVHLLDFDQDIYGTSIEIEILSRIRDEKKFSSVQILIEQIKKDTEVARSYFSVVQ